MSDAVRNHVVVDRMRRILDAHAQLAWLPDLLEEAGTGYDIEGWQSSTWILHAMYENESLKHLGSHDDLRRELLARGLVEPDIIGNIDLDALTTTGVPIGFVVDPGEGWQRVRWSDYLARSGDPPSTSQRLPPCYRWFPHRSWPAIIQAPPEGSLDGTSLDALVGILVNHTTGSDANATCFAFYGSPPAFDDAPTLWSGPLSGIRELVDKYEATPTNIWPPARSWFVYTDWDLGGTKVSGSTRLIEAVRDHPDLESVTWPSRRVPDTKESTFG